MKHHTKEKGDIAVVKIIADLTEKNYTIFLPISEHLPFDLIAYKDGKSNRIQCKYTSNKIIRNKTSWADKNGNHTKFYGNDDFDYYGLYLPVLNVCVYPSIKYGGCSISTELPTSFQPFYWYEDFLNFTDDATKKTYKDFNITLTKTLSNKEIETRFKFRKVVRPSKEELEKLLWEQPTTKIAQQFGVSDKAISLWAKNYGISKPPRGYWAKLNSSTQCNFSQPMI
jgi:hypothetical protein